MKLIDLPCFCLAALAIPASAYPTLTSRQSQPDFSLWAPPGKGDVRSPCPGINVLANHYILPHDGKNINLQNMTDAIKMGYNFGPDFALAVFNLALSSKNANFQARTIDLDDVDQHNYPIEQDASLSRKDAYFGNPAPFDSSVFAQSLKGYGDTLSVASHAKAHVIRVNDSKARNPEFLYGARQYVAGYFRDSTGIAAMGGFGMPLSYFKYWISKEKLPTELGWTVPANEISLVSLGQMSEQLAASAGSADLAPNGVKITADTIKDVLELRDPITGFVVNALNP